MTSVSTTKLSSRGQVVIPEEVRKRLGLETGAEFVVVGDNDTVILKRIQPPNGGELTELLRRARKAAKKAGLRPADVTSALRRVRTRR